MSLSDAPAPAVHEFPPIATSDRPRAADKAECRHDLQDRFLRAGREAVDDRELLQLPLSGSHSPAEAGDLAANLLDTFGRHGVCDGGPLPLSAPSSCRGPDTGAAAGRIAARSRRNACSAASPSPPICTRHGTAGRVANLSIATDESYIDRQTGERVDRTEWHRVVTVQNGLIDMFEKHAKKGRLVYVAGKLQTRRWKKDGEDSDRFSTEIPLVPGGRVQFLDKPSNGNGAPASNGETTPPAAADPADPTDEIPF